jgi:hypothetical protein
MLQLVIITHVFHTVIAVRTSNQMEEEHRNCPEIPAPQVEHAPVRSDLE